MSTKLAQYNKSFEDGFNFPKLDVLFFQSNGYLVTNLALKFQRKCLQKYINESNRFSANKAKTINAW